MSRIKLPDLTGHQFGDWTVIGLGPTHPKFRYKQYHCQCVCGIKRLVNSALLRSGRSVSCGCRIVRWNKENSGNNHPCWKGGRWQQKDTGYVIVRKEDGAYDREHIVVMERKLGRPLLPDETVHHKNGIRNDNSEDNLELRVRAKHPKGASVEDLLTWAHELINRYDNISSLRS